MIGRELSFGFCGNDYCRQSDPIQIETNTDIIYINSLARTFPTPHTFAIWAHRSTALPSFHTCILFDPRPI